MIFRANLDDAKSCIRLLRLAMDDIAYYLSGSTDDDECNEILTRYFLSQKNRISHKNVYVFKQNSQILGAICVYFGGELDVLDAQIIKELKDKNVKFELLKECESDEFYIDSIAVDENFRGQGIAKKLIHHTFDIAKQNGYAKVSLVVDKQKLKTREFYESLGFKFNQEKELYGHKYDHLIKEIV
ncbi:GNAT family N-acetyltransferase [Campylobacter mucosalis]|uniref:GNAT family N-acetyltransferase n=1 Tax=Campylobacter mucosalis TaxID=202 RepID=UPI0014706F56|nr:GNAT family N-acetyltransferase [Campylobacter mucosalis]